MIWQFYRLSDGGLTHGVYTGHEECLAPNIPYGYGAVSGWHDPASWRVADGVLVEEPSPVVPISAETLAAAARARRASLFADTEWIRGRSADRGEAVPQAWLDYWQALRDVPEQAGFPDDIEWPVPPAA